MKLSFKLVSALAGLLVFALIAITAASVVARYVLGTPIQWTEEMSAFLLIWIVFLGAIACEIEDHHLKIDVVTMALPDGLVRWLGAIVGAASVGLLGYMAWLGYVLSDTARNDRRPREEVIYVRPRRIFAARLAVAWVTSSTHLTQHKQ